MSKIIGVTVGTPTSPKKIEEKIKPVKTVNSKAPDENGNVEVVGNNGVDGKDGISPTISVSTITGGHRITITDKDGTKTVDVMDGTDGEGGASGADGVGIANIAKTATVGKVDTYTITLTNGTKTIFTVTNGADGADGKTPVKDVDYFDGKDGTSVTITKVTESTEDGGSNAVTFSDGKTLTVKNGSKGGKGDPFTYKDFTAEQLAALKGANGNDGRGIKSVTRTGGNGEAGTTDTYTITYTDNTTSTFTVCNGMDGRTPYIHGGEWWIGDTPLGVKAEGKDGVSITAAYINDIGQLCLDFTDGDSVAVGYVIGRDGEDGTSVTITNVTESDEGGGESVVYFSDGNTLTVKNGRHGDPGSDGNDGVGIANIAKTSTNGKVDTYTITFTNGTTSTFTVTNGKDAADGKDGADGYTPVRGTDFWTPTDKNAIIAEVGAAVSAEIEAEVDNQLDGAKADVVTELIAQLGGLPVFGTVNDDMTITVTSTLADGTYTLMYTDAEGNLAEIGKITVDNNAESYINLVPTSIDTDGSVFNGTGYQNNAYLSSSTGKPSSKSGYVATGYMELGYEWYVKGATYSSDTSNRVFWCDDSFEIKAYIAGTNASGLTLTDMGNGVTKFTVSQNWATINGYKYVRMSLTGTGENLIISATPIE